MLIVIPILLILWLILLSGKQPVYSLGIPFVYAFWEAIFIPAYEWKFLIGPIGIVAEDVLFALFFFVSLYISLRRKPSKKVRWQLEMYLMVLFIFFLLFEVVYSWIFKQRIAIGTFLLIKPYIYWPLSIFIWLGIMQRITTDEILRFLNIMAWITVALMIPYILSSRGMQIYPGQRYMVIKNETGVLVRDLLTFPYWVAPSFFFFGLKINFSTWSQRTLLRFFGMTILLMGLLAVQTRSKFFSTFAIFSLLLIYNIFKGYRIQKIYVLFYAVGAIGLYLLFMFILPAQLTEFINRIQDLQTGVTQNSLTFRTTVFLGLNDFVFRLNPLIGVGFYIPSTLAPVRFWGDMMWFRILFDLGWAGIIIFSLFLLVSIIHSISNIRFATSTNEKILAWLFFMICVFSLIMTMTSESYTMRYSISTFAVAGVLAVYNHIWKKAPQTQSTQQA